MQNISEILNKSINYLKENNTNSAVLDSELLLCSIINKPREYLFLNLNKKINDISVKKYFSLVKRRKNSEPIAYILNKKDFWKSTFYVDQGVLIPRPDTEILIEEALSCMSKKKNLSILDIGTGSGCIILSILQEVQKASGIGIDISKNAVKVANFNAKMHQLENRVKFIKSSVDNFFKGKYDLIISNPPYINNTKLNYLEKDIYKFEPAVALKGGNDGLSLIRKVIEKSSKLLKTSGKLILEIGYDQKFKIEKLLKDEKFYVNKVKKDYGQNFRCIVCTKI